jgi:uncharacterized protein YegP (UPF0339 family)
MGERRIRDRFREWRERWRKREGSYWERWNQPDFVAEYEKSKEREYTIWDSEAEEERRVTTVKPIKKMLHFEVYRDDKREYRWRLKAKNGKIVAQGEGYKRRQGLYKALAILRDDAPSAPVLDLEEEE